MQNLFDQLMTTGFEGNSTQRLLLALATFLVLYVLFLTILPFFLRRVKSHVSADARNLDRIVYDYLRSVPSWVWGLLALLIALRWLVLLPRIEFIVIACTLVIAVILSILVLQRILEFAFLRFMHGSDDGATVPTIVHDTFAIILWIIGGLLVLSNLGVNITSLIAGLGVTGIAVALAAQRILGDIFSSFSIYLDKPFREGDYIVTGDHSGFVRRIGIKTTRIQAVAGEEIIIPNQELTQARVRNYKRMHERHVEFTLLVAADTPVEKLRMIPQIARTIIDKLGLLRFERATLASFNKTSITYSIVYDVKNSDHESYVGLQQEINLQLLDELRKHDIALG